MCALPGVKPGLNYRVEGVGVYKIWGKMGTPHRPILRTVAISGYIWVNEEGGYHTGTLLVSCGGVEEGFL